MIEWNKTVASVVQILVILIFFILLIYKRKKLSKGIIYFIIASGIVAFIETSIFFTRMITQQIYTVTIYIIGVNFFAFLLFFIYFRQVLELKKSKNINLLLIGIFLVSFLMFALFSENFFSKFPFYFYFLEVILLMGNIYLVLQETFNSDKVLNIRSYYPFWACIGLMAIYLGVTPLLIISNTTMKMMNINIFFIILFIVNVIGYSILISGVFYAKSIDLKKNEPFRN